MSISAVLSNSFISFISQLSPFAIVACLIQTATYLLFHLFLIISPFFILSDIFAKENTFLLRFLFFHERYPVAVFTTNCILMAPAASAAVSPTAGFSLFFVSDHTADNEKDHSCQHCQNDNRTHFTSSCHTFYSPAPAILFLSALRKRFCVSGRNSKYKNAATTITETIVPMPNRPVVKNVPN